MRMSHVAFWEDFFVDGIEKELCHGEKVCALWELLQRLTGKILGIKKFMLEPKNSVFLAEASLQ